MKPFGSIVAVLGTCLVLGACMPPPPVTASKEDLLSSSGFKTVSLNTPAKVAAFKTVPAHQLTRKTYKGNTVWVYPDRDICGCMSVGSQNAYNRYIKKATQNMISTAVRANDSDDPYSPTSFDNTLDYDWASDPEAYGLYSDW